MANTARLKNCWPGKCIGRRNQPCSLAKAIREPENETEPISAEEFSKRRMRASLRADQAADAEQRLREMLEEELIAREELRGAVRRRRSLEELESRRIATQAGLAAAAAQRALDELAAMRQQREDESDDR